MKKFNLRKKKSAYLLIQDLAADVDVRGGVRRLYHPPHHVRKDDNTLELVVEYQPCFEQVWKDDGCFIEWLHHGGRCEEFRSQFRYHATVLPNAGELHAFVGETANELEALLQRQVLQLEFKNSFL